MRILITGANGFMGRHLVQRLVGEHQLYALVRRPPAQPHPQVTYLIQDLAQPLDLAQLPGQLDGIVHQAAQIDTEGGDDALPFLVNVVGTWRLLTYAATAGVRIFVHASTGGVYGCSSTILHETDPVNPMDLYSLTKAQAELAVQSAPGSFHRVLLRYFFPYGVGTPNPIPQYVERAVQGKPVKILQGGGPHFNPLHISDAVTATVRSLALTESQIINVAGQETTTFGEIASLAGRLAGQDVSFTYIPDQEAIPYYQSDLIASTQRMQRLLQVKAHVDLQTGIQELVDHIKLSG